ncbi:MAG: membrane protein insertase YidC [Thermodesulfobacteriota bacterium]
MEQVRFIIAVTICVILYLGWTYFFQPAPAPKPPSAVPAPAGEQAAAPEAGQGSPPQAQTPASPAVLAAAPAEAAAYTEAAAVKARKITVDTPLYRAVFSTQGACLTELYLKKYKQTIAEDSPDKEMVVLPEGMGTLTAYYAAGSVAGMATASYSSAVEGVMTVEKGPGALSFSWTSPGNVTVVKEFSFQPDSYVMNLSVSVENHGSAPISDSLSVKLANEIDSKIRYGFAGGLALVNRSLTEEKPEDLKKENGKSVTGKVAWVGLTDQYFLSAIVPATATEAQLKFTAADADLVTAAYVNPVAVVEPNAQSTAVFHVFFGPKSGSVLQEAGMELSRALDFGWLDFIAKPCLWLMKQMYRVIPNYGVAIILLTVLVKLLFWPLSNKSYKSMAEMKKIQPLMQEIRDKYKNDKKRMNEEVFALYRTYRINPMSGCLPILVQIPVFIALYKMLYGAIELRHAPFMLWINDLAAPDRLLPAVHLPFVNPPGIPVLTLIMGASMFIQQKMSPPPGDPAQARMMMILPLVFTFLFINFPSGLVLYWLVNNILSMAQQYYIQRKTA